MACKVRFLTNPLTGLMRDPNIDEDDDECDPHSAGRHPRDVRRQQPSLALLPSDERNDRHRRQLHCRRRPAPSELSHTLLTSLLSLGRWPPRPLQPTLLDAPLRSPSCLAPGSVSILMTPPPLNQMGLATAPLCRADHDHVLRAVGNGKLVVIWSREGRRHLCLLPRSPPGRTSPRPRARVSSCRICGSVGGQAIGQG
jgi:hypothetical protein